MDVDAIDLRNWADRHAADGEFPQLIRRLVLATVRAKKVSFRSAEGVRLGGWDGERQVGRREVTKVRSEICLETRLRALTSARAESVCHVGSGTLAWEAGAMIEIESPGDLLVAAGPDWRLYARSEGERIFYRVVGPYGGGGSFSEIGVGTPPSVGVKLEWGAGGSPGQPLYLFGTTTADVAAVRVEMTDGTAADVPTIASDAFPVRFFVAVLPPHLRVLAVVALDASGAELERLDASATLEIPADA